MNIPILFSVAISGIRYKYRRLLKKPLNKFDKGYIISKALLSKSGQQALADAMAGPICRSLDYNSVGRKLLNIDNKGD